jgi:hypothetical protein
MSSGWIPPPAEQETGIRGLLAERPRRPASDQLRPYQVPRSGFSRTGGSRVTVPVPWPGQRFEEEVRIMLVEGPQSLRDDCDGSLLGVGWARRGRGCGVFEGRSGQGTGRDRRGQRGNHEHHLPPRSRWGRSLLPGRPQDQWCRSRAPSPSRRGDSPPRARWAGTGSRRRPWPRSRSGGGIDLERCDNPTGGGKPPTPPSHPGRGGLPTPGAQSQNLNKTCRRN